MIWPEHLLDLPPVTISDCDGGEGCIFVTFVRGREADVTWRMIVLRSVECVCGGGASDHGLH